MRFGPKIRWDLTLVCNLNCRHCQVGARKQTDHPSKSIVFSVFERIVKGGVSQVGLLGGEPLTYPYIIELLDGFVNHGIPVTISTNGLVIPSGLLQVLNESSGWSIMVSIDGPDADTHESIRGKGTFEPTIRNIKFLTATLGSCGLNIGLACTVTALSVNRLKEVYDLSRRLGVQLLQFGLVKRAGNAARDFKAIEANPEMLTNGMIDFLREVPLSDKTQMPKVVFDFVDYLMAEVIQKELGISSVQGYSECPAADSTAFVDSQGNLWPCPPFCYASNKLTLCNYFGLTDNSLLSHEFEEIWYGKGFRNFRELKRKRLHLKIGVPCNRCKYRNVCVPCPLLFVESPATYYPHCDYQLGRLHRMHIGTSSNA